MRLLSKKNEKAVQEPVHTDRPILKRTIEVDATADTDCPSACRTASGHRVASIEHRAWKDAGRSEGPEETLVVFDSAPSLASDCSMLDP